MELVYRPLPPASPEEAVRYERLDVVASGPDAASAPDLASAPDVASAPVVASAQDALVVDDDDGEDDDREYDFQGESSESGASVAGSVAADDDLEELDEDAPEEDPFGFFDAAEAESNLSQGARGTEKDGRDKVPEEPTPSSRSVAAPELTKKKAVFIDVEDESETCAKCEVPKVHCKCLQIEQLKRQLNALKVQRRARTECHDPGSALGNSLFLCLYTYIYIICVYTYVYVYMHAYIYIYISACTNTHMHVHVYR